MGRFHSSSMIFWLNIIFMINNLPISNCLNYLSTIFQLLITKASPLIHTWQSSNLTQLPKPCSTIRLWGQGALWTTSSGQDKKHLKFWQLRHMKVAPCHCYYYPYNHWMFARSHWWFLPRHGVLSFFIIAFSSLRTGCSFGLFHESDTTIKYVAPPLLVPWFTSFLMPL